MENFVFNGDWEIEVNLKHFELYFIKVYSDRPELKEQRINKDIYLRICDQQGDFDPDPNPGQINAINYLLQESNQIAIIHSIVKYLNDVIYTDYDHEDFLPKADNPNAYPTVHTLADFQKYFRLEAINVYFLEKENFAYYSLTFGVKLLDDEHGLCIDLHKDRCIEHGPGEGTNQEKIVADLPPGAFKKCNYSIEKEKAIFHQPHLKYNKLKPWQVDANERFPYNAFKNKEDELLMKCYNDGIYPNSKFKYIYLYAKRDNRNNLVEFFERFDYFKEL